MQGKQMIDAVRVAGAALVVALLVNTKKDAKPIADTALVERERKRLLDVHVLQSVFL